MEKVYKTKVDWQPGALIFAVLIYSILSADYGMDLIRTSLLPLPKVTALITGAKSTFLYQKPIQQQPQNGYQLL